MSDIESLASAMVFTDAVCADCRAPMRMLVLNPETVCDECLARREASKQRREAMKAFDATVPPLYGWARLDAPELAVRVRPATAVETARLYLREPYVVLGGPSASGKTSLAVALVRERVRIFGEPWMMSLAFRLGSARIQHRAGDGEALLVERAMAAKFLLLDDLGQETMTATNPIADIIQHRDAEMLPTWITTGLSRADVGTRYGGGVARRVFDRSKILALGSLSKAPPPFDHAARRAGES